jgi:hypothetical protein
VDGCVVAVLFNQFVGGAVDVDGGGHKELRISSSCYFVKNVFTSLSDTT